MGTVTGKVDMVNDGVPKIILVLVLRWRKYRIRFGGKKISLNQGGLRDLVLKRMKQRYIGPYKRSLFHDTFS